MSSPTPQNSRPIIRANDAQKARLQLLLWAHGLGVRNV
jgi:hypothetical protein